MEDISSIPEHLRPYHISLVDPIVAEQVSKKVAYFQLRTKIPALVTIQSFTRMLLAKRKAVMLTKRKATDCLNEERDTHGLVSSDDLLYDLNQPVAKGQTIFDNLNVHYIGASEDPRKNDDNITNEGLDEILDNALNEVMSFQLQDQVVQGVLKQSIDRLSNFAKPEKYRVGDTENLVKAQSFARVVIAKLEMQRRSESVATLQRSGRSIARQQFRIKAAEDLVKGQSFARMVIAKLELQRRSESVATLQRFGRIIARRQFKSFTQLTLPTIGAQTDEEEAVDIEMVESAVQKIVSERLDGLQSIVQRMFSERLDGLQEELDDLKVRVILMERTVAGQTAYYTKIDSEIHRQKSGLNVLGQALEDYLPVGSDNNYFEGPENSWKQ